MGLFDTEEPTPAKDILQDMFATIEVYKQLNGNRTYYYPANDAATHLLTLMKRKTFIKKDIPFIKKFGEAIGVDLKVSVLAKSEEL